MDSLVETDWLEAALGDPDLRVLDCTVIFESRGSELHIESGRSLWQKGHIPTSSFVDLLTEISDQVSEFRFMMPAADQFASVMERVGVGSGTRVVLYDADRNMWAARVWWMLRAFGFVDAAVLNGGWRKWTLEGRPVSTDPAPELPSPTFRVEAARPGIMVDKHAVLAAIDDSDVCIVNALSAEQHAGKTNDYGRPGHIPGAVNVPAADLVDPDNHAYLPREKLFDQVISVARSGTRRAITYCGGAISAASSAFVLALLGHEDVAIYDGSMNEWGADPSLPLEV